MIRQGIIKLIVIVGITQGFFWWGIYNGKSMERVNTNAEQKRYTDLLNQWNDVAGNIKAKKMFGTGEWYCGNMVVSCNEKGYLNMDGNLTTNQ